MSSQSLPKWYLTRRSDELIYKSLCQHLADSKLAVALIEGAPGVGKTAFARAVAEALSGQFFYFLCHHWLTEEELFVGIDVGKAVAGVASPEEVYKPGILLQAAKSSKQGMTVLCLDELDKAPERVEGLLLDFLQTGKVYGINGEVVTADFTRLIVIITSNGVRQITEPLLRRCVRLRMENLSATQEQDLLRKITGASQPLCKVVVALMNTIRADGETTPSIQEAVNFLDDLLKVAESYEDVEILINSWLCKTEADQKALQKTQFARLMWSERCRNK